MLPLSGSFAVHCKCIFCLVCECVIGFVYFKLVGSILPFGAFTIDLNVPVDRSI